jgi:hypothetical protein
LNYQIPDEIPGNMGKLIFTGLLFICNLSFAQKDNRSLIREMFSEWLAKGESGFSQTTCTLEGLQDLLPLPDSSASRMLEITDPEIRYEKLKGSKLRREVVLSLVVTDSLPKRERLVMADTLSRAEFKEIYRSSPRALKGENPLPGPAILVPAAVISASVIGLAALFYVRSR